MLSRDDILNAFDGLNVWSRGSQRAPHKSLLVLYALGQLSRGGPSPIAFRELAPKLTELLQEFGPSRKTYHPEYPFWRLQNDEAWVVDHGDYQLQRPGRDPLRPVQELFRHWSRCRDGTITRRGLKRLLAPVRWRVENLLLFAAKAPVRTACAANCMSTGIGCGRSSIRKAWNRRTMLPSDRCRIGTPCRESVPCGAASSAAAS